MDILIGGVLVIAFVAVIVYALFSLFHLVLGLGVVLSIVLTVVSLAIIAFVGSIASEF